MKKIFMIMIIMAIAVTATFADSWFTIDKVKHQEWSRKDKESTCIFIYNSKYIVCYELPGVQEGLQDLKGYIKFKYLDEVATGGKDSLKSKFNIIIFLKNNGIQDIDIWICPRTKDGKWQLYENNHVTF